MVMVRILALGVLSKPFKNIFFFQGGKQRNVTLLTQGLSFKLGAVCDVAVKTSRKKSGYEVAFRVNHILITPIGSS